MTTPLKGRGGLLRRRRPTGADGTPAPTRTQDPVAGPSHRAPERGTKRERGLDAGLYADLGSTSESDPTPPGGAALEADPTSSTPGAAPYTTSGAATLDADPTPPLGAAPTTTTDAAPNGTPTAAPNASADTTPDVPSGPRNPPPPIPLQINALQAMCRQVFGFRLAMIALATPAALLNASPGLGVRLVGAAVVVTFMGSYVLFRDWERFGPLLLRHPTLLAVDTVFGTLLLISAGPDTTLAYVSVCTPLLAGIVYGWRGAACFASLQSLILLLVHATLEHASGAGLAERLLLPGLCVITGAVGSTLRNLMLRFGTATQALTTVKARLAVTEAVAAERARLAREMHDSVAKTLHGVALAADGLARSAGAATMDPARVRQQAALIARAARRAAAESRELLTDLRRETDPTQGIDVLSELAARTEAFAARTGLTATHHRTGDRTTLLAPPAVGRHLLTIASEAMENAHRHADATRVEVRAGVHGDLLTVSVLDDGRGFPPGATLDQLRRAGHFGVVGMAERAASVGARISIGRGPHARGTEVSLHLPLAALPPPTP